VLVNGKVKAGTIFQGRVNLAGTVKLYLGREETSSDCLLDHGINKLYIKLNKLGLEFV
jgi:hypothetical protein